MADSMKMVCGLDIGNGYVKGKAKVDGAAPILIDLPSTVSYTVGSDIPKSPSDEYMADLVNELDVTISSRGIRAMDEGRVFFGRRGIRSGESAVEFNIENHVPKCKDSLSTMLIVGSVAASAIGEYWKAHGEIPADTLRVECVLGIALPIEDYMDYRDEYRRTLMGEPHHAHVHNFDHTVNVEVRFVEVVVLAEGAAGQYAITSLGADFLQMALDIARDQGASIDAEYTGEILLGAANTIGIDIGEGTTNFPVFANGDISIESSASINKGYGTVLTNVVAELRNTNYAFESRKDLADFMLAERLMPAQRHVRDVAQNLIDKQVRVFARDVMKEYTNIFRKVGIRTDAIYVYGGGANAVRSTLYPMLIEASTLDDGHCLPVIYLDSAYSRDLNRNGLFEAAELSAEAIGW